MGALDALRRQSDGVERDAFGFPVYPNQGGLAARLRETRPEPQRAVLDELRSLTPETMPEQAQPMLTPEQAVLMALGLIPGLGDVVGVGADAYTLATDPESRTLGNLGLAAAGLLPVVPGGIGSLRHAAQDAIEIAPVRRAAKAASTQAGRSANGSVASSELSPDGRKRKSD